MNLMRPTHRTAAMVVACVLCVPFILAAAPKKLSPIISIGANGNLVYDADERGNRVPDFSTCGYAGGDRPIPDAPVRVVVPTISGDETARIQKAIDYVAGLPADTNGIRGAVLLLKGRHRGFWRIADHKLRRRLARAGRWAKTGPFWWPRELTGGL